MISNFENYKRPEWHEIFEPGFLDYILDEKIAGVAPQVMEELLEEERLERFINGKSPYTFTFDCKSLYELGALRNPRRLVGRVIESALDGIYSVAVDSVDPSTVVEVSYEYNAERSAVDLKFETE